MEFSIYKELLNGKFMLFFNIFIPFPVIKILNQKCQHPLLEISISIFSFFWKPSLGVQTGNSQLCLLYVLYNYSSDNEGSVEFYKPAQLLFFCERNIFDSSAS